MVFVDLTSPGDADHVKPSVSASKWGTSDPIFEFPSPLKDCSDMSGMEIKLTSED